MFTYLSLAAFAGVLVFGVLFIIMGLKGGPWKLPSIGMMVCFALLIASVVLPGFWGGEKDPGTADEPSKAVESREPEESLPPAESEGQEIKTPEATEQPGKTDKPVETGEVQESTAPKSEGPYVITYQNCHIYRDLLGEVSCYILVEIENTSKGNLYLKSAAFDFEDENGNLLGTCSDLISSDPDIIAPGEKGYFYCNMGSVKGGVDENTNYVFKPTLKVEEARNNIVRYDVTDLSITSGKFGPVDIIGRVTNNTNEGDGLVWVFCVLYRSDGTPIAAYGTNVTDLDAGQTASFDADAIFLGDLDIKLSDVADYKVYACKTQYQF